jgi:hypothetical protein
MIAGTQVFNGIDQGNNEKNHHTEPHGYMEIEIPDRFIQDGLGRNSAQEAHYESIDQKNNAKYFPPFLTKHITIL